MTVGFRDGLPFHTECGHEVADHCKKGCAALEKVYGFGRAVEGDLDFCRCTVTEAELIASMLVAA